jgi:hypothetical protein
MSEAQEHGIVGLLMDWTLRVGRLMRRGCHTFALTYPAPPTSLTLQGCEAAGFGFFNDRSAHIPLNNSGTGMVRIDFSPDLRHHAVSIKGPNDWSGALLWVDSEVVPVPRSEDGDPLCKQSALWLDDRFVYVETGGLWNHPLLDPNKADPLGEIRSLLIWDSIKQVPHEQLPRSNQAWTAPVLIARENSWRIYPNSEAFQHDRPDRVVPIPN